MNKGDAGWLYLNISVNNTPITSTYAQDIELTFNDQKDNQIRKTLKENSIVWDSQQNKYKTYLSQVDTFKMEVGNNSWQIRILVDNNVISSSFGIFSLGNTNSGVLLK